VSGYNNESDSYDDLDRQDGATGGGLRKQLEQALAKIDKLQRDIDGQKQADTAVQVLKDKGLDPAIRELIPEDQDPKEWVEKYAHLLGTKTKASSEDSSTDDPDDVAQVQEDEDPAITLEREALSQIQGAADAGSPAHLTGDVLERMDKISSEDELMAFFQSNGALGG